MISFKFPVAARGGNVQELAKKFEILGMCQLGPGSYRGSGEAQVLPSNVLFLE